MTKKFSPYFALVLTLTLGVFQLASGATQGTQPSQPTLNELVAKVKSACQPDIQRFCSDVRPGGGRIADCLSAREDKLSFDCRTAKADAESNISHRINKTEVAFRNACGSDVQRFCTNVPSGGGRILDCLSQNKDQVSYNCRDFQAKLEQKLSEFLG